MIYRPHLLLCQTWSQGRRPRGQMRPSPPGLLLALEYDLHRVRAFDVLAVSGVTGQGGLDTVEAPPQTLSVRRLPGRTVVKALSNLASWVACCD
jgi:hypothetical protein